MEIGAGVAFLIGWKGRFMALVLAIWCVATALVAHGNTADGGQVIHFYKNLSMAGGFSQVVVYGSGAFSLDRR